MALLYERTQSDGEVTIRLKAAYYLVRYALLALVAAFILLESQRAVPGLNVAFGLGLVVLVGTRIIGFWAAKQEITEAMRTGSLRVSGSAWSYKNPMRYEFRVQPPAAAVVSRDQ